MRFKKAEELIYLAELLQRSRMGLGLEDLRLALQELRGGDVSRRTAERMRDALERLFPLEQVSSVAKIKKWRLNSYPLPRLTTIGAEDLAAIELGARTLQTRRLVDQAERLRRIGRTLQTLLEPGLARRAMPDVEGIIQAEGLAFRPGPRTQYNSQILDELRYTILAAKVVKLTYRSRGTGKISRQTIHPYGFVFGARHYLIAFNTNERSRGIRLFEMSRITRVELSKRSFVRDKDFVLSEYLRNAFEVYQGKPQQIVLRFAAEVAEDAAGYLFHPTQSIRKTRIGDLLFTFRCTPSDEICWEVFRWSGSAEIIAPASLRNRYYELLAEGVGGKR